MDSFRVAGDTIQRIFSVLRASFGEEFSQYIRENNFQIYDREYKDGGEFRDFAEEEVSKELGDVEVLHVYPSIEGSGRAGQIIAGVVLIVVGVWVSGLSFGGAAQLGGGLISAGVGLILSAVFAPKAPAEQVKPEERASYVFNNPANVTSQGGPVPLVYGRFRCGTTVVSSGISAEQLSYYSTGYGGGGSYGGGPAPDDLFYNQMQ